MRSCKERTYDRSFVQFLAACLSSGFQGTKLTRAMSICDSRKQQQQLLGKNHNSETIRHRVIQDTRQFRPFQWQRPQTTRQFLGSTRSINKHSRLLDERVNLEGYGKRELCSARQ